MIMDIAAVALLVAAVIGNVLSTRTVLRLRREYGAEAVAHTSLRVLRQHVAADAPRWHVQLRDVISLCGLVLAIGTLAR